MRCVCCHWQAMNGNKEVVEQALGNMGACYHLQGKFAQALDLYDRALALNPDSHQTLSNAGAIYTIQARDADAFAVLTRALNLIAESDNKPILVNLAILHAVSTGCV